MSINHICSFGSTPHTASFLKVNELYPISYPFDWININLDNYIAKKEHFYCVLFLVFKILTFKK